MKDLNVKKLDTLMFPLLEEGKGNRNLFESTPFPGFYCTSAKLILGLKFFPLFHLLPQTVSLECCELSTYKKQHKAVTLPWLLDLA